MDALPPDLAHAGPIPQGPFHASASLTQAVWGGDRTEGALNKEEVKQHEKTPDTIQQLAAWTDVMQQFLSFPVQ